MFPPRVGPPPAMRMEIIRSFGAWGQTIRELLSLVQFTPVLTKLSLSNNEKLCSIFWNFVVELVANRANSQLHHTYVFPYCFPMIFVPTMQQRAAASTKLQQLARVCLAVLDAKKKFESDKDISRQIQTVIDKISTLHWVLTQEILHEGGLEEWNPESTKLREMAWSAFASSAETKQPCENAFGWISDTNDRQGKANKTNPYTKYAHLCFCPYASTGGTKTLVTDPSDIQFLPATEKQEFSKMALFYATFDELPFKDVTKQQIMNLWRPAGFYTQRAAAVTMAAAAEAMNANGEFEVQKLQGFWSGCLFVRGQVYYNRISNQFVLALGFFQYGCISIKMKQVHHKGEAPWPYQALLTWVYGLVWGNKYLQCSFNYEIGQCSTHSILT